MKRSRYVQLKEDIMAGAMAQTILIRGEEITCRVMINIGLELLIAGAEFLKMHGIAKDQVLEFVDHLFDRPGPVVDMVKGGINEPLLRMAMKLINGPIIDHDAFRVEMKGQAHVHKSDDVAAPKRNLNPNLN